MIHPDIHVVDFMSPQVGNIKKASLAYIYIDVAKTLINHPQNHIFFGWYISSKMGWFIVLTTEKSRYPLVN